MQMHRCERIELFFNELETLFGLNYVIIKIGYI